MTNVTIKRCPVCQSIGKRAEELATALQEDLGVQARIEDGAKGELSVLVDEVPVIQRDGDSLPSVEEVEAAVRSTAPVGV